MKELIARAEAFLSGGDPLALTGDTAYAALRTAVDHDVDGSMFEKVRQLYLTTPVEVSLVSLSLFNMRVRLHSVCSLW